MQLRLAAFAIAMSPLLFFRTIIKGRHIITHFRSAAANLCPLPSPRPRVSGGCDTDSRRGRTATKAIRQRQRGHYHLPNRDAGGVITHSFQPGKLSPLFAYFTQPHSLSCVILRRIEIRNECELRKRNARRTNQPIWAQGQTYPVSN